MQEAGYVLGNLDCTIIAQKPKLSPHKVRHAGQSNPDLRQFAELDARLKRIARLVGLQEQPRQQQEQQQQQRAAAAAAKPLQVVVGEALGVGWRLVYSCCC
jgi:hypothetical protein